MPNLPLLLLPGMHCDAMVWEPLIGDLGSLANISVPDCQVIDSIGAMAEVILASAPEQFAVAGHSQGGRVALEIYRRAPERVRRLGLFATGFSAPPTGPAGETEAATRHAVVDMARSQGLKAMAEQWVKRMLHPERLADRELVDSIVEMVTRQGLAKIEAQARASLSRPDASAVLAQIRCPTLILAARDDLAMPVAIHEQMAQIIVHSTLKVIEHCGHMMTLERPQVVSAAMVDWLRSAHY